jgi:hypothetical protein
MIRSSSIDWGLSGLSSSAPPFDQGAKFFTVHQLNFPFRQIQFAARLSFSGKMLTFYDDSSVASLAVIIIRR